LTERGADGIEHGYAAQKGVEAVLKRLDRFIENEARSTAAQTLQVVYGLVQNVKTLVDGKQIPFAFTSDSLTSSALDCKASRECVRETLSEFGCGTNIARP
jgi:hypothetical protein